MNDFVAEAKAKRGREIKDAVVEETTKGERIKTTMGVNLNGNPNKIIQVV